VRSRQILGAAWASLASDGALVAINMGLVLAVVLRSRQISHLILEEEPVK
jgi:hypothetical protein